MAAIMEEKSSLGLREVALLVFVAFVIFVLISLVSFSNEDAGFSHSGPLQSMHNACGVVGAWISDFTLSLFGLMGYCVPLMFAWIGYLVYRDQLHTENNLVIIVRYIGFVITLAFGSALLYLHLLRTAIALPGGTGGILGQELGDFAVLMLGNSGATLLLLVGFLAGITLLTDLSWLKLMDTVGRYTLMGVQAASGLLGGMELNFFKRNSDTALPEENFASPPPQTIVPDDRPLPRQPDKKVPASGRGDAEGGNALRSDPILSQAIMADEKLTARHGQRIAPMMDRAHGADAQAFRADPKFNIDMNRPSESNLSQA